jgi:hypothetical protein
VAGYNYYGAPNCPHPQLTIPPMYHNNIGWIAHDFFVGVDTYYGPGSIINRLDHSSFFLRNNYLKEYPHTLYNRRVAEGSGRGNCYFWYEGQIFMGFTPVTFCHMADPVPY